MIEKLKAFFKSEKLKEFFKKVFNKKIIAVAIVIIVLMTALSIGFSLMFQVKGTVMKVDGNNIVVANFFYTKTVNTGDLQIDSNKIQVGERIKITKNLYGDVISIKGENRKYSGSEKRPRQMNPNGGDEQRGSKGKE